MTPESFYRGDAPFFTDRLYYKSPGLINSDLLPEDLIDMRAFIEGLTPRGTHEDNVSLLHYYSDRAIRTADSQGRQLGYLLPGLLSEYGEVVGKYAKSFWHQDWPIGKLGHELALELGDVMWMVGGLFHTFYPPHGLVDYPEGASPYIEDDRRIAYSEMGVLEGIHSGQFDVSARTRVRNLGYHILRLIDLVDSSVGVDENGKIPFEYLPEGNIDPHHALTISSNLIDVWVSLLATTASVTGANPIWVMEMNLQKLSSRAERGTLIGNGDHR